MSTDRSPTTSPATAALSRQALQLAMRVLELAAVYAKPHDMSQANAQVGRCLKASDDLPSAETYLDKALSWARLVPGVDTRVDVLCELAELTTLQAEGFDDSESHTRQACLERARGHAFEAAELAGHTADSHWEVKVLLRVSDVFNRCGDHDDATQVQNRAMALLGLQPAEELAGSEPPADPLRAVAPTQLM
jgi:hypothetical protein